MQGISVGTIGNLEVVKGTAHDAGRVALRTWDSLPNNEHSSVEHEVELSKSQAAAFYAMLGLAVEDGRPGV